MNTLKTVSIKRRSVNLFFAELIIALLFFSISGAVILQVFAAADKKAQLSAKRESAMLCAQSIAEVYSENGDVEKTVKTVFSNDVRLDKQNGNYLLRLDEKCKPSVDGVINVEMTENRENTPSGEFLRLTVSFAENDEALFSLDCSAYIPSGGGSNE